MTICHKCGGQMTVKPSYFPGFDVLGCEPCDRPIKLLVRGPRPGSRQPRRADRSEEHTSELQSRQYLVCRLLLEKKKTHTQYRTVHVGSTATLPQTHKCRHT